MQRGYPDINFFNADSDGLVSDFVAIYEHIVGRTLRPADPVRLVFLTIAGVLIQTIESFNWAAKQNLPRFAEGKFLDSLAEVFHKVGERLAATSATTVLRFTVETGPGSVVIPEGVGASTVGGDVVFVTTQTVSVQSGTTEVDVPAECVQAGTIGNGFMPGQICRISGDSFSGFQAVKNITETGGGSEAEDDDAYYERMRLSMEAFSTAGPAEAYEFFARTARGLVSEARATSPAPAEVVVRILLQGGEMPTQEVLDTVEAYLSDRTRRPLTDHVTICAPEAVPFDVEFTYWLSAVSSKPAEVAREDIQTAVNEYVLWQRSRIGRDINPSVLHAMVMDAGARRVEIVRPVFRALDEESAAVPGNIAVHPGGIEHD